MPASKKNTPETKEVVDEKQLEEQSTDIVIADDAPDSLKQLLKYCNILVKSSIIPSNIKKPESLATIILMGRELGIPDITAVNNIDIIGGKPTLKVSMQISLLLQKGITFEVLKDFEPIYEVFSKVDGIIDHKDYIANKDKYVRITKDKASPTGKHADGRVQVILTVKDYETEIKFYRTIFDPVLQKPKETSYVSRMTLSDCYRLTDKDGEHKDNYEKQPDNMLWVRTFSRGVRRFAGDVISGMYADYEMLDVVGKKYHLNSDKEVIIEKDDDVDEQPIEEVN